MPQLLLLPGLDGTGRLFRPLLAELNARALPYPNDKPLTLDEHARWVIRHLLRQFCLGRDASVAQLNLLRETLASVPPQVLSQRLALAGARHSFGRAKFEAARMRAAH